MKKFTLLCLFVGLCFIAYPQCQKSYSSCSKSKSCKSEKSDKKDKKDKNKAKANHKHKKPSSNDRFVFAIGPGTNYTADPVVDISDGKGGYASGPAAGFESSLVNFQGNGFLGYKLDRKGHRRANTVGVWGTFGFHSPEATARLLSRHEIRTEVGEEKQNEFYEVEVGMIFRDWVRLSAGIGGQGYTPAFETSSKSLQYFSITTGINIPITKWASWQANISMLHGMDYERYSFRPSTGFNVNFPFGKF